MTRFVATLFPWRSPMPKRRFHAGWVHRLDNGIRRHAVKGSQLFVVSSTDPLGVQRFAPTRDYLEHGYANMLEMFRPEIIGHRAVLLGLDTVLCGDLTWLDRVPTGYWCHRSVNDGKPANGCVVVDQDMARVIWQRFEKAWPSCARSARYLNSARMFTEELWLDDRVPQMRFFEDVPDFADRVVHYKDCIDGKPERASIVYFPGHPKPDEAVAMWVRDEWR